jgi:hypothetical protein
LSDDAPELPHDFGDYSFKLLPNGLVRVSVDFEQKSEVAWRLQWK